MTARVRMKHRSVGPRKGTGTFVPLKQIGKSRRKRRSDGTVAVPTIEGSFTLADVAKVGRKH